MARLPIRVIGALIALGVSPAWAEEGKAESGLEEQANAESEEGPAVDPDSGLPVEGEAAASDDGATADLPPDLVRLSDGGILRGVVIEYLPRQKVTIRLPSGETRTIDASLVTYAGPAEDDPGPAAATPPKTKEKCKPAAPTVKFVSNSSKLKLYVPLGEEPAGERQELVRIDDKYYQEICEPPCSAELEPGRYWLAAGVPGEEPVAFSKRVWLGPGDTVAVDYGDNSSTRPWGWAVLGGGIAVGGLLMAGSYLADDPASGLIAISGLGIMAVTTPVGLKMAFTSDWASFEVRPPYAGGTVSRSRAARLTF